MRQLPPLHALRAFEAAARHASVTQAAAELRVSHSAVSQHLRSLELYFGQPLFLREGRRIAPTTAATILLEEIGSAFDRIAFASQQFAQRNSGVVITVNATPSFAMRWLIPRSSNFQIENPSVSVVVETSTSDGIDHLSRSYNFIFRRAPMERPDHICQRILDDVSTPVVAPSLAGSMHFEHPGDVTKTILLHLKSRPDAWRRWLHNCAVDVPDVLPGPYYEHFFLSLQAAISGLGIAIAPLCFVDDDLDRGRLVAPFPDRTLTGPGFHVLYQSSLMRSRYHRAFLDALLLEAAPSSAGAKAMAL